MTDYLNQRLDYNNPQFINAFDEMPYWSARFAGLIFEHLTPRPHIRALDIGCGTGCPLFELAQLHGPGCSFTGIDVWDAALARAVTRRAAYGLPHVHLLKADASHMPFPDEHFDLLTSNLGVNNFSDPPAVLRECFRITQPGGRLILTTNIMGHMAEFYGVYRQVLSAFGQPDDLERLAAHEAHRGTRESVTALVEGAGYSVANCIEDRFHYHFLDGSALLRHWIIRLGFLDGWRAVVDPGRETAIFTHLEAALNTYAQAHGGLTLTVPQLYVEAIRSAS